MAIDDFWTPLSGIASVVALIVAGIALFWQIFVSYRKRELIRPKLQVEFGIYPDFEKYDPARLVSAIFCGVGDNSPMTTFLVPFYILIKASNEAPRNLKLHLRLPSRHVIPSYEKLERLTGGGIKAPANPGTREVANMGGEKGSEISTIYLLFPDLIPDEKQGTGELLLISLDESRRDFNTDRVGSGDHSLLKRLEPITGLRVYFTIHIMVFSDAGLEMEHEIDFFGVLSKSLDDLIKTVNDVQLACWNGMPPREGFYLKPVETLFRKIQLEKQETWDSVFISRAKQDRNSMLILRSENPDLTWGQVKVRLPVWNYHNQAPGGPALKILQSGPFPMNELKLAVASARDILIARAKSWKISFTTAVSREYSRATKRLISRSNDRKKK